MDNFSDIPFTVQKIDNDLNMLRLNRKLEYIYMCYACAQNLQKKTALSKRSKNEVENSATSEPPWHHRHHIEWASTNDLDHA